MNPGFEPSRDHLIRLLVGCPHDLIANPNPMECPLYDKRELSLRERLAWARTVDSSVVDRVVTHHDLCLARKKVLDLEAYEMTDV
jgi:hypothetical protein